MQFAYRLVGTGWAEADVGDGTATATLTASYLGDALGDLLYAIWRLLEGDAETRCSWAEEPGEYRWIMQRDGDYVHLRVLEFMSTHPPRPDEAGRLVFESHPEVRALARAIALGASRTLEEHGEQGYKGMWGSPFPTKTLELIRDALESPAPGEQA